ncbi:MAG: hypothetical protein U0269_24805 [Polyangiales bacterium]
MSELRLCDHCERHIRESESRCPFCDHACAPTSARRSTASVLFAVAAAATVAACYGGPQRNMQQNPPQNTQPSAPTPNTAPAPTSTNDGATSRAEPTIGEARMLADGTLVLDLESSDLRDSIGAGSFRYPTVHPQYEEILAHVGPMQPGQRRPVRAF